jgi:hypothetical protein
MEAKDFRNRVIKEGAYVKYLGTSTSGIANEICEKRGKTWVKIDKTGLYYLSELLILIDGCENPSERKSKEKNLDNILKPSKNYKRATSTEISDHTDGPGYGGG